MSIFAALRWFFRRWFWNLLAVFKAVVNKPLVIPLPQDGLPLIVPRPLSQVVPGLAIDHIPACLQADIPADERVSSRTRFYRLQTALYRFYPPMQPGLPPIDADPERALANAYTALHRWRFAPPALPAEFLGSPDLGALAVRGPYAGYLQAAGDGAFVWDVQQIGRYEHHRGLRRLGATVRFEVDRTRRALRAVQIDSVLGRSVPGDATWERSKQIALCTLTTDLSLVRHFNFVHLAFGSGLAIATRNRLPAAHPLRRLLWPYVYGTQQSNDMVTRGQMLPGGDFECTFSLSFAGLCRCFDETFADFDIVSNDPEADAQRRGVVDAGFDMPTERNLAALFDVMHQHARRYLAIYYASDEALRADAAVAAWLDELNTLVPNGVAVTQDDATLATVARLLARCIYAVSAQHELLGSFVWNYQLWTHREPVRIYANGEREPLDVYQRLVNANFNLNVHRRELLDDFAYLALDAEGAAAMRDFDQRLRALQGRLEAEPWAVWKLYPQVLKVNINA